MLSSYHRRLSIVQIISRVGFSKIKLFVKLACGWDEVTKRQMIMIAPKNAANYSINWIKRHDVGEVTNWMELRIMIRHYPGSVYDWIISEEI